MAGTSAPVSSIRRTTQAGPPRWITALARLVEMISRRRREIISTNLANAVIHRGGPACVVRLIDETGADVPAIVTALVAVDETYGLKRLNDAIDGLDTRIDGQLQLGLYAAIQDLLLSRMVWYVRNVDLTVGLDSVISRFGPGIRQIAAGLDQALPVDLQA